MLWWRSTRWRSCDSGGQGIGGSLRAQTADRAEAIALRKRGLSYSEIQAKVPVSQATLSLWLRRICLTSEQRRRLADLKLRGSQAGAAALRDAKHRRVAATRERALKEAQQRLADGDVDWAIGAVLYWGEGAKVKPWGGKERVVFTNMDPRAIRVFRQWLFRHTSVTPLDLACDLRIHPDSDAERAQIYWARMLGIARAKLRIYFKRPNLSTRRKNVGKVYYGTMRLSVRRSTMLLHRIEGWIQGIAEYCGVG